jgi:hypothetical protein
MDMINKVLTLSLFIPPTSRLLLMSQVLLPAPSNSNSFQHYIGCFHAVLHPYCAVAA